ncbi:hypothetical protein, variant [Verruconis gallopava]|uniref:Major facilitator superfamily (MFS) profile domain-containing protein n=1 Tax=Verruconis gallopava TaxID=253628 RepID=A0A0D2BBB8_9PEZI|nr:uncharacterized protein PV09_00547 [Verruconis gallopava]XP_016218453.1 hypothetical protein, variant [Verruconis gallopava]KIW08583.1 hypothetical protein PV09_00547 [Verruconis gallopava]KIW08584.1 hypothetical protein, variant [Verruconis gallopava]
MKDEMLNAKATEASEDYGSSGVEECSREEEEVIQTAEIKTESQPLSRTQSRRSEIDPFGEPPDGGLNAWLKVLGCFLIYSNIWGFTLTFGAFQNYYQHHFLSDMSPSSISWIGTVQSFLLILVGCMSGPLFDLGYFRPMLFFGNFLVVFGLFMLSLAKEYYQVFLAQAVCIGLGAGLLYIPSLALIGLSFSTKRSVAQGITTAGIAVGGIAYILAFDHLSSTAGFGWAVRVMGFISLGICGIAFPALLKGTSALAKARAARKLWELSAFKDRNFLIFTACSCSTFLGYIVPYFYISVFASDALGIDQNMSLNILIIAIAASFFGRLVSGMIAFRMGPIFTWFWCAASSGIVSISWLAVKSQPGLIAWAVFWGFCSAGLVTLPAAVFPTLCSDLRRLGTLTGMSWGISSFASLIGSPIAGAILKHHPTDGHARSRSDFLGPALWAGVCLLLGSGIIFILWALRVKETKKGYFI